MSMRPPNPLPATFRQSNISNQLLGEEGPHVTAADTVPEMNESLAKPCRCEKY